MRIVNINLPENSLHSTSFLKTKAQFQFIKNERDIPESVQAYIDLVGPDRPSVANVKLGIS